MISTKKVQNNKFVLDTNFFISGFEANPSDFGLFLDIITEMGIELYVTTYIMQEIRWYLRRRIKPPIQILKMPIKEIREYKENLDKEELSSPQINDLSNIVAAKQVNAVVVSSDLKLVRTCEALDVPVLICSSFVFLLRNTCFQEAHN